MDVSLSYIMDLSKLRKDFSQVPIVKDFSDVFPGELPRMLSNREVEFSIELEHDILPISYLLIEWQC